MTAHESSHRFYRPLAATLVAACVLRGDTQSAKRFVGEDCGLCKDAQWSLERKQFAEMRGSK